jgi:hypothetical protein
MAAVIQELICDLLNKMHADVGELKYGQMEYRTELNAERWSQCSRISIISYGMLGRHEQRLECIENRLELRELSEARTGFEPHP